MNVLVTGGAGYIGSHTLIELQQAGHTVTVVDDLSNSSAEAIKRVEAITNKSVSLHVFDLQDHAKLDELCAGQVFDAVIHFAGLKAVGESTQQPIRYYQTNLGSTLTLLDVMTRHDMKRLIFSSSATVYGDPAALPITEESPVGIGLTNPYGKTKYMIEEMLRDLCASDPDWSCLILRYFNPIGAHQSGTIGEDPQGIPNNLFPYIAQVAVGKRQELTVHGDDYDTIDGTGVRDYIHVVDLARGHVAALNQHLPGCSAINLGTGQGVSVLQAIKAFELVSGKPIPFAVGPRRPGDIASCYASAEKAFTVLHWKAEKTISDACEDAWRWQSQNPHGYTTDGSDSVVNSAK